MALRRTGNGNCRSSRPTSESVASEIDGQDFDHAMWVAAWSLSRRWVELIVDPSRTGNLVVNGLGVARPFRDGMLAFHHAGGTDFRRLTRCHCHVIPELLSVSQAYAGRQLIPDTEELAVHKNPENWLGRRAAAGTAGSNVRTASAGSGVTPAVGRPRHSHRPPARSGWPAAAGPTARRAVPRRTPRGRPRRSLRATLAGRSRQGGRSNVGAAFAIRPAFAVRRQVALTSEVKID
jgi:hypothetical protein